MTLFILLKVLHIISMSLFLGAGFASAVMKLRADRTKDARVISFVLDHIVWADWVFTIPSGVLLPVTGLWMASVWSLPLTTPWVAAGITLYAIAGVTWLPAAVLQIRMRKAAHAAAQVEGPLPPDYWRWTRTWFLLAIPSFAAALFTTYIMTSKNLPFWS